MSYNVNLKLNTDIEIKKLSALKNIKTLTGLGLKESKFIIDDIIDNPFSSVSINITYNESDLYSILDELKENGIIINNNREVNLDEILTNFSVYVFSEKIVYNIIEGSYKVKENILTLDIKKGIKRNILHFLDRKDVSNIRVILPFSQTIIEDKRDV